MTASKKVIEFLARSSHLEVGIMAIPALYVYKADTHYMLILSAIMTGLTGHSSSS